MDGEDVGREGKGRGSLAMHIFFCIAEAVMISSQFYKCVRMYSYQSILSISITNLRAG